MVVEVTKKHEGVIFSDNFKISPFRKLIEKLFALRQQCEDEHNLVLQNLVQLLLNSLYTIQICKDITEFYKCKTKHWMKSEFDENVLDYWKLPNGDYIVKLKQDFGLKNDDDIKNTLSSHLGAFI